MVANVTIRRSKHVQDVETQLTLQQTALIPTRRAEKRKKSGHLQSASRSSGAPQPKAKGGGEKGKGGKGAGTAKTCWNCGETGHLSSHCPMKKVHAVEDLTTASQVGSQDTTMVGHFDLWQRE